MKKVSCRLTPTCCSLRKETASALFRRLKLAVKKRLTYTYMCASLLHLCFVLLESSIWKYCLDFSWAVPSTPGRELEIGAAEPRWLGSLRLTNCKTESKISYRERIFIWIASTRTCTLSHGKQRRKTPQKNQNIICRRDKNNGSPYSISVSLCF